MRRGSLLLRYCVRFQISTRKLHRSRGPAVNVGGQATHSVIRPSSLSKCYVVTDESGPHISFANKPRARERDRTQRGSGRFWIECGRAEERETDWELQGVRFVPES
jgi:hypothetical protein